MYSSTGVSETCFQIYFSVEGLSLMILLLGLPMSNSCVYWRLRGVPSNSFIFLVYLFSNLSTKQAHSKQLLNDLFYLR